MRLAVSWWNLPGFGWVEGVSLRNVAARPISWAQNRVDTGQHSCQFAHTLVAQGRYHALPPHEYPPAPASPTPSTPPSPTPPPPQMPGADAIVVTLLILLAATAVDLNSTGCPRAGDQGIIAPSAAIQHERAKRGMWMLQLPGSTARPGRMPETRISQLLVPSGPLPHECSKHRGIVLDTNAHGPRRDRRGPQCVC